MPINNKYIISVYIYVVEYPAQYVENHVELGCWNILEGLSFESVKKETDRLNELWSECNRNDNGYESNVKNFVSQMSQGINTEKLLDIKHPNPNNFNYGDIIVEFDYWMQKD